MKVVSPFLCMCLWMEEESKGHAGADVCEVLGKVWCSSRCLAYHTSYAEASPFFSSSRKEPARPILVA